MAILEKEISITLSGSVVAKHYEEKGYEIPRWVDNDGILRVKQCTIIVNVDDLLKGSGVKVTKVCDECGKNVPNQTYASILASRQSDGKDRCFTCGRKKASKTNFNNTPYEKSLEFFAIKNNQENLLLEFSSKNDKKPSELSQKTSTICWWNCPSCNSEYDMSVASRTGSNNNCPYCRGLRVNHTNCLWTVNPKAASLLTNPEIGYIVTNSSAKIENFTCPDCGYIAKKTIVTVVVNGFCCPQCSDNISYPEKFMMSLLNQLKIKYKREKSFIWSKNVKIQSEKLSGDKRYDFYIPSLNCIIETHGIQHYTHSFKGAGERNKTLEEETKNDQLKEKLAKENGINHYIVIDCRISDSTFIKNSIISSEMKNLFDLLSVDWVACESWAINSFARIVCDLWNSGDYGTTRIAKELNIGRSTAHRYLKIGAELGWCDYIPEIGGANKRSVIQLTLNGELVKEWNSAREAAKALNINLTGVTDACNGRLQTTGGYRWMFKENYNPQEELKKGRYVKRNQKPIVQLTLENQFIAYWDSVSQASKILELSRMNISNACKGKYKQASGFKWLYKSDYEKLINQNNQLSHS